jgi:hypothetical protein
MTQNFPRIPLTRRTGTEGFHDAGRPLGFDLLGFWQWAISDLVGNALRGILAEYIVARALGVAGGVRSEWDACDLRTPAGLLVEVKSASYLQSWHQKALSRPTFTIRETRHWSADTNEFASTQLRHAHVYVFAVLAHRDQATFDPLDVSQWEFHVLAARVLDARCAGQKKIGLAPLLKLRPTPATFESLREVIERVAEEQSSASPTSPDRV